MTAATATAATTIDTVQEAEWYDAVDARHVHDMQVRSYWTRRGGDDGDSRDAGIRREQGAKRAHLTRRIIRAEKAIDAARA